ncbi:MAG: hypothetical protein KIT77_19545 [Caldilinea sp.]|nr:hypothetical protein [Caldilinea sp.]MCB0066387.1 hypothetical protein [Caldilineaceae bacterium]MCB9115913.1 hypothetical protein [Caldilineaceae bacterium]MCB9120687.1 hypothetical protein [Caldilineaceae bacterium]MCW5843454.1 hypothetical protein [Caldilinea sp.]
MRKMVFLSLLLLLLLAGCTSSPQQTVTLAADELLPPFLTSATPRVRDAYRFAVANPDTLAHIPCYCGCGNMGHTSNLSCYVQSPAGDGAVTFDEHANGCGICVDITQDVMRLSAEGQSLWEIRTYVDAQYSPFGPSTDTPLPPQS